MFYKQKSLQNRQERERKEVCLLQSSSALLLYLLFNYCTVGHVSECA